MMRSRTYLLLLFVCLSISSFGQSRRAAGRSNSGKIILANFSYGVNVPAGDLSKRFGQSFAVAISSELLTEKNFLFGIKGALLFGNKVKEDVIAGLRNEDGLIFSDDLGISGVTLSQRGFQLSAYAGKIVPMGIQNSRSGMLLLAGIGFLQHRIHLQDEPLTSTALLSKDYKKGYDRLSNGLSLLQFIGYQHLSANRRINFKVGFELTEAFTQNQRSLNFDQKTRDSSKRFDVLPGFHLAWTLPFYIGEDADEIQY